MTEAEIISETLETCRREARMTALRLRAYQTYMRIGVKHGNKDTVRHFCGKAEQLALSWDLKLSVYIHWQTGEVRLGLGYAEEMEL